MWTLADIRDKVRKITGRKSIQQLSNEVLDDYINDFIVYDLVKDIKPDSSLDEYIFYTEPNVRDYPITGYCNIQPNVYVSGYLVDYYQDWNTFVASTPSSYYSVNIGTGNGVTFNFTGTFSGAPMIKGSLSISDNTETFTDDAGSGILTGTAGGTGTIDYVTGTYTLSFFAAPVLYQDIYASFIPYISAMPTDVLVFKDTMSFYPIPDQVYQVKLQGYKTPSLLSSPEDIPDDPEWGPLIAIGAARQIFLDNGEIERIAEMEPMYKERKRLALRKTLEAMNYERSMPRF